MDYPPEIPSAVNSDDDLDVPPLPNRGPITPKVSKAQAMMASQRLYGLSAAKHRKRVKAQKLVPKGCTFQPQVNKHSKRRRGSAPIGDRLYKQRAGTQRRKEALKKKIYSETFKPDLATKDHKIKKRGGSRQKRINKLFNDSKTRETKLRAARKKKEEVDKSHGFKPKISKKARKIKNGRVSMNGGSSMIDRAKKLKQKKERQELKNCTFKPKLTRSRSAPKARVSGNFLQRMSAFEAKKGQNISKLLQKQYNRDKKNLTFAPKRDGSRRRRGKKQSSTDIGNRLYHMGRERDKALQDRLARKKTEELNKFKFKPKIGRSKSAGRARPRGGRKKGSIYDRLYGESRLLKENREKAIKKKEQDDMQGMFQPKVSPNKALGGRKASIWDRLAVRDVENRERAHSEFKDQKKQREMEECSFNPEVDVEREEEEYDDIFDRLYETDIGATDYEPTGLEECTFEPDLPDASRDITTNNLNGDVYDRLHDADMESKQMMAREMTQRKKKQEFEGCTFTPNLDNNAGFNVGSTSKSQTFARLATPKTKIPKPAGRTKRSFSKKGKSSFMDRVKQKAQKSTSMKTPSRPRQKGIRPASRAAPAATPSTTPAAKPAPEPARPRPSRVPAAKPSSTPAAKPSSTPAAKPPSARAPELCPASDESEDESEEQNDDDDDDDDGPLEF